MGLTILDRQVDGFHVVQLDGDIDIESARDLHAHFTRQIADATSRVVVDLSGVDFMDSTGLAALVGGWHMTRDEGDFRVAGANPVVQRVLSITGMEDVFQVFDTVGDATGR